MKNFLMMSLSLLSLLNHRDLNYSDIYSGIYLYLSGGVFDCK